MDKLARAVGNVTCSSPWHSYKKKRDGHHSNVVAVFSYFFHSLFNNCSKRFLIMGTCIAYAKRGKGGTGNVRKENRFLEVMKQKLQGTKKRVIMIGGAILLGITATTVTVIHRGNTARQESGTIATRTVVAQQGNLALGVSGSGTTYVGTTNQYIDLSFGTSNLVLTVEELLNSSGATVKKGDPLFRVSKKEIAALIQYYEEQKEEAQNTYQTAKLTYESNLAQAKYEYETNKALGTTATLNYEASLDQLKDAETDYEKKLEAVVGVVNEKEASSSYTVEGKALSELKNAYEQQQEAQKRVEEAERKLQDAKQSLEKQTKEYEQAKQQKEQAEQQVSQAKQQYEQAYASYEKERQEAESSLKELKSNYSTLKASYEAAVRNQQTQAITLEKEYESSKLTYENAKTIYEAAISGLGQDMTAAKERVSSIDTAISNADSQLSELSSKIKAAKNTLSDYKSQVKNTKDSAKKAEIEQKVTATEQQIESLQSQYDSIKNNYSTLTANLSAAKRKQTTDSITAKQEYETNKLTYNNADSLYQIAMNGIDTEVTAAQETLNDAKQVLADFKEYVGDGTIKATVSGTVMSIGYSEGEELSTSTPIATYSNAKNMTMSVSVSQEDISVVTIGDTVQVEFTAYEGETYEATVSKIETAKNNSSTVSYNVTVTLSGDISKIYTGMTGNVTFVTKQVKDVVQVSNKAIKVEGTTSYVVKVENGVRTKTKVQTGFSDGINVEIVSGLKEGDTVLIESQVNGS